MAKSTIIEAPTSHIAEVLNEKLRAVDPISVTLLEVYAGITKLLLVYQARGGKR